MPRPARRCRRRGGFSREGCTGHSVRLAARIMPDLVRCNMGWEATMIVAARAALDAGLVATLVEVKDWIVSIGTDHELPAPRERAFDPGQSSDRLRSLSLPLPCRTRRHHAAGANL